MGVDKAGWRATRIAKVTVDVVLALLIIGTVWVAMTVGGSVFSGRVLPHPGLIIVIPFVAGAIGLFWLRAFLRDVTAGQVFTSLNAQRLSRIGWLLISVALLRVVIPFLLGGLVSFYSPMMLVPMLFALVANGLLVSGLLLLVIAAAWRYGIELQSERDLTV